MCGIFKNLHVLNIHNNLPLPSIRPSSIHIPAWGKGHVDLPVPLALVRHHAAPPWVPPKTCRHHHGGPVYCHQNMRCRCGVSLVASTAWEGTGSCYVIPQKYPYKLYRPTLLEGFFGSNSVYNWMDYCIYSIELIELWFTQSIPVLPSLSVSSDPYMFIWSSF